MIGDLKPPGEWIIHLTMKMDFVQTKGCIEHCHTHLKCYNSLVVLTQFKSLKDFLNPLCKGLKWV